MIFTHLPFPGVLLTDRNVFGDDRGFFMESYRRDAFGGGGISAAAAG